MLENNQLSEGLQPLEETLLLQEFQVEELEKRYEFSWISGVQGQTPYGNININV
jgi:hypothetical protein